MTGIVVFLVVSFTKNKNFHPSRVKLRKTHHKKFLVDNPLADPRNYFKIDQLLVKECWPSQRSPHRSKYEYDAELKAPSCQAFINPMSYGLGMRFSLKLVKGPSVHPLGGDFSVSVTDHFGRSELFAFGNLPETKMQVFFRGNLWFFKKFFENDITECWMEINSEGFKLRIPGESEYFYPLSPDETQARSESPGPKGKHIVDQNNREHQFEPLNSVPFFNYDSGCGLDTLITPDLVWLQRELPRLRHLLQTDALQLTQDVQSIVRRVSRYLEPPVYFHVRPIAESTDESLPHKKVAVELCRRYEVLRQCDLSSVEKVNELREAVCTQWMAILRLVSKSNSDTIRAACEKSSETSNRLLELAYPSNPAFWMCTSLAFRFLSKHTLFGIKNESGNDIKVGVYTVWRESEEFHFFKTHGGDPKKAFTFKICDNTEQFR